MNKTIFEVQLLRFIASFMVLFVHTQHEMLTQNFIDKSRFTPFEPLYWAAGVDIFFVISGFIMLYHSFDKFGQPDAASDFMVRRIIRVVPAYWIFTLLMLVAIFALSSHVSHANPSLQQIVGSFLFLPLPDPYGHYYPVLMLGWTLNFEMLFYVIFAIGLLMPRKMGIAWILVALVFLGGSRYFGDFQVVPLAFWSNSIVFNFLLGMLLAYLRLQDKRLSPPLAWTLCLAGFAILVFVRSMGWQETSAYLRPVLVGLPAFLICMPALARSNLNAERFWPRLMVFGGNISFALYLSHPFPVNLIALIYPKLGLTNPLLYIILSILFALVTAALVYQYLEKPVTGKLHAITSRRRSTNNRVA